MSKKPATWTVMASKGSVGHDGLDHDSRARCQAQAGIGAQCQALSFLGAVMSDSLPEIMHNQPACGQIQILINAYGSAPPR